MTELRTGTRVWRTSSYCNATGGDCVEVADGVPGLVPVRDSKNTTGPALLIPTAAWGPFLDGVKGFAPGRGHA